jgi:Recombination endonuclease VII
VQGAVKDGQQVCIDHDRNHCRTEKRSRGECVRGLLCLSCNTALGQIERKYAMARAYLDSPPWRRVMKATAT